jgi:phage gp36-like protein
MTRYADRTDLTRLGLATGALTNVPTATQDDALDAASAVADGYLRGRFELPLTAWGDDLRRAVCGIASYDLMVVRGFAPGAGNDETLRLRYEDAVAWLKSIALGHVIPVDVTDATPDEDDGGTFSVSNARRRWLRR